MENTSWVVIVGLVVLLSSFNVEAYNDSSINNGDHFKNGILFVERGLLFNINSRVVVPIIFKTTQIENSYLNLLNELENICAEVKLENKTELNEFLVDVETLKYGVELTFKRVVKFFNGIKVTRTRQKRGAINFIGDIGSVLFGLSTEEQLGEVKL